MTRILKLLMPLEWIVLVCAAIIIGLYSKLGVRMPGAPGPDAHQGPLPFFLKQILTALDLYCLIMLIYVAWQLLRHLQRHRFSRQGWYADGFWQHLLSRVYGAAIVQDLRFMNALLVMFIEFGLLKHLIPLVNPKIYDEQFLAFDRLVCNGQSCSEFLHALFGRSEAVLAAVAGHYYWYYGYMSLIAFVFIVCARRRFTHEYLCSFVTLFLVGTLVIYLVPTWGPVYYMPEPFTFMQGTAISNLQQGLWAHKAALELNRNDPQAIFMISGFPSLHVAVVMLGSIYLGRLHRLLAVPSWAFCLLTVNSTIYLGWHYLLDDIGSVVLVWFALLVGRWCARHPREFSEYSAFPKT